jgi:hypothetical protein
MREAAAGALAVALTAAGIVFGSRGLRDYDVALLPYTIGVLFAAFTGAHRYVAWLRRPPTALYWRRGFGLLFGPGGWRRLGVLLRSVRDHIVVQGFIRRRGTSRWVAHVLFAGGSTLAAAVTFPLVFGWMHFETRPEDTQWYRLMALGHVAAEFHTGSVLRVVMFNLLNLSAVLVIAGTSMAIRRRLTDPGVRARQQAVHDLVPLAALMAISVTGLMLTFSTHVLGGRGYSEVSLVHAVVVTGTLVYLPYGKFFHVVQRPARLGVALYRRANDEAPPAVCRTCGDAFAGGLHVADMKAVLSEVGLDFRLPGPVPHYAEVCPRCRRRLLGFTQGRAMDDTARAAVA